MSRGSILLVDDDPVIIDVLRRHLGAWAAENSLDVLTASSAAEAERLLDAPASRVCVLLSDVRMPGGSGTDLVVDMRARHPEVVSLILSSQAEAPELMKALAAGVFSYLVKPVDGTKVRRELDKALHVYRLQESEREHRRRLDDDLAWAAELEQALFGGRPPAAPPLALSRVYRPLPEFGCGGDYCDVVRGADGRVSLLVGDVAGHGVRAALVAAFLKSLVIAAMVDARGEANRPEALLTDLNEKVCRAFPASQGVLVTLAVAVIDPARGELVIASAGHPPALLVHDGAARPLAQDSLPLGARQGSAFAATAAAFGPGDALVLYTDGIVETPGVPFSAGLERLAAAVAGARAGADMAEKLVEAMRPESGYDDDVTVLTASMERRSPPPPRGT